jgi:Polyketide cyclase / dehydrase and lipid transport
MASTVVSITTDASPDRPWERLRSFATWHTWLPRIVATTMEPPGPAAVGSVRSLELADGSAIRERLLAVDDLLRTLSYSFDGPHPYPVRNYVGTVRVEELTTTGGSYLRWSGHYDVDAADEELAAKGFRSVYSAFLDALVAAL